MLTTEVQSNIVAPKFPGCKCDECPLKDKAFVPPKIPDKDYKITFVGQAPANQEVRLGEPLVGQSGLAFNSALEEHDIPREDVRIDNAILCYWYSNSGERPPVEAIEACKGHLNSITSKVIVPMGNDALGVFTGQYDGILSVSGRIHPESPEGFKILPLTHPAYYLRSAPNDFRDFKNGIRLAKDLAQGKDWSHVGQSLKVINDRQEAIELFNWLRDNPPEKLSLDLETDIPDIAAAKVTSLGLAWNEDSGVVIPWSQEYQDLHETGYDGILEFEDVYNACKEALEAQKGIIAYNATFDICILRREGMDIHVKSDVLLKHYALDERVGVQSLKYTAGAYLGIPNWEVGLKRFLKKKDDPYTLIPPEFLFPYQNYDTTITLALDNLLDEIHALPENEGPARVYREKLSKWIQMLIEILPIGARMDLDKLKEALNVMPARRAELVEELQELTGYPLYNPNSYLDNRKAIFETFKLPKINGLSTDKDVLEALEDDPITNANPKALEFIQKLREFKQYQKVVGTYLVNLAKSYRNGYGHADLKLFGTVTGRLSANKFNPLVFPRESRGGIYGAVKEVIVPDDDSILIQADYSGMELRILAVLANDPYMLEVLSDPKSDWHATMAQEMYEEEFLDAGKDKRKEMRVIAKMLVFGLNYGRGTPSIAGQLGCSKEGCKLCEKGLRCKRAIVEATHLVNKYFEPIPRVKEFREESKQTVKTIGYLEIPSGRRRRFDMITSANWHGIEKQIYNSPMQSMGNDCNMEAMYEAYMRYREWVRPLWPIHDAALWNVKKSIPVDKLDGFLTTLQTVPSEVLNTSLPFYIDVDAGTRWGQLKSIDWQGPGTTKNNARLMQLLQAD